MQDRHDHFMQQALALAAKGVEFGHGGPFGAVVVVADKVIGRGWNCVIQRNDPTAHAEILAIREACKTLGSYHLSEATLYTTCEPCPMCMGALYWARIDNLVYAATTEDAAKIGFDDHLIREALRHPLQSQRLHVMQLHRTESQELLHLWQTSEKRIDY